MEEKQPLPNAAAVLVLGICSIVFTCFYVGLILGIIGLALAAKGRKLNRENPGAYTQFPTLNAGWICSLIGTILGGLYLIYIIVFVAIMGSASMMSNAFH